MVKLFVVPQIIVELLEKENLSLAILKDVDQIATKLSANDIAEIHAAMREFPFQFDPKLDIQLAVSPYHQLAGVEKYESLYRRVSQKLDTAALEKKVEQTVEIPRYSLNVVDGTLWVAVLLRQCSEEGNLGFDAVTCNLSFFNGVIAQVLHNTPFEEMCSTNLFADYLRSLNTTAKAA